MNLLDLFIKVGIDDQATDGISGIADKAKNVAGAVGDGLATAAKVGTAAVGAASTAVAALTKSAVDNYADYEQLVGGVETLFKESADAVLAYADGAYRTSGLSANEYMETVTSFSASLLQSLEGDTAAAADAAQEAIIDMADNANKMGTSMASIQNAYMGFAKQNFSMLDNLKLGYGGTQLEMYRLMSTAAELDETFAATAEFSIDAKGHLTAEFADITKAIHIVQTEMGITGTTALEASTTISGSVASAGAAWSNLITGIADDNSDFDGLITSFVDSVSTAASNLIPRIEIAIGGIANMVTGLAPVVADAIPMVFESVVPAVIEGASSLVSAAGATIPGLAELILAEIPSVIDSIGGMFSGLGTGILENLDYLIQDVFDISLSLADALIEGIGGFSEGFGVLLESLVMWVEEYNYVLVERAVNLVVTMAQAIVTNGVQLLEAGIKIIGSLMDGVISALPELAASAGDLINALVTGLLGLLPLLVETGVELLSALVQNLPAILANLAAAVPVLIQGIVDSLVTLIPLLVEAGVMLFTALVDNLPLIISIIADSLPVLIEGIVDGILLLLPEMIDAGFTLFIALVDAIPKVLPELLAGVVSIVDSIIGAITGKWQDIKQAGVDLLSGLGAGITEGWNAIKSSVSNTFSAVTDFVKGIFDEHSPSRVFAGIGENLMEGLWVGVDSKADSVMRRIGDAIQIPTATVDFASSALGKSSAATINSMFAMSGGGMPSKIVVPVSLNGRQIALATYDDLEDIKKQRG